MWLLYKSIGSRFVNKSLFFMWSVTVHLSLLTDVSYDDPKARHDNKCVHIYTVHRHFAEIFNLVAT